MRPVADRLRSFACTARFVVVVLASSVCLARFAAAGTITAKGGNGTLNRKQSWIGNKVPGAADIALWNSSSAATTASLGANLSWLGVQILSPAGALTFNSGNTLTLGASGIDMSAATVDFNLNCAVVLGAAQTWSVNSGRSLSSSGIISGSNGLTKSGLGVLTLSGANTYAGSTTINAGTLSIANGSALGSGSGSLTINPTGVLQATGTFSTSRAVILGGTGGAASGGTFDVTAGANETRSGVISGSGSLTKTGSGTLTLTGTNTFTGDVFVNGGTLVSGSSQALGPQPTLGSSLYAVHLGNGTTLQTTISSPGGSRQLELVSGTATLDVVASATQQRNGLVYGAGGLIKSDSGTLILTSANTYTGGTTVNGGVLQLNNASGSGTGSGALTVNSGATLSGLPTASGYTTAGSVSGVVTANSGGIILARSGSTFTFGGLMLNASAITNFQLGAVTSIPLINITNTNGLTLAGLSTINISNTGGLSAGTYHLFDYSGTPLASISNLQLGSTPGGGFTYSLSNNQTNGSIDLLVSTSNMQWGNDASGTWSLGANWSNGAAPNAISAQANFLGVINNARNVTVDGAFTTGTITFNSSNAYTVVSDGVSGHGLTLNNGGTASITALSGSHMISAPLTLANDTSLTATSGATITLSGAIGETLGAHTMTADGAGTVTLSGIAANTYTGLTTAAAGTLNLNKTAGVNALGSGGLLIASGATVTSLASNQIADTAPVTVNGTWNLGTSSETIGALNGVGSLVTGSGGVLTIGAANNLSSRFEGIISGGGTLSTAGTGILTLAGTNTFGGPGQTVGVNGGTLEWLADTALGNAANSVSISGGTVLFSSGFTTSRAMALSGSATIDSGINAVTINGAISGTGSLTKTGNGSIDLGGSNTYSGGTSINAGTVIVHSATSLGAGSGALNLNNGTLQVASGFSTSRNIVLGSAASTIQVDAGQYSVSGSVSGSGALNKSGSGALTLSSASTFSGETVINAGTLTAGASSGSALASTSAITVHSGGTLLLGASNQINNNAPVTLDGGTFAKGNFAEGTASTVGLGALTLTATGSRIDFGTGTVGILNFTSFDPGVNLDVLTIDNWTGIASTAGTSGTDRLIFNADQSSNLSYFQFTGYSGATEIALGGNYYEVVPLTAVPEPATWIAGGLAVVVILRRQVRASKRRRAVLAMARGFVRS